MRCSLVVHTTFSSIRTTVADGILRLNPHHLTASVAPLGHIGTLDLMVEVNHFRLASVPSAKVVVNVGFHCSQSVHYLVGKVNTFLSQPRHVISVLLGQMI